MEIELDDVDFIIYTLREDKCGMCGAVLNNNSRDTCERCQTIIDNDIRETQEAVDRHDWSEQQAEYEKERRQNN